MTINPKEKKKGTGMDETVKEHKRGTEKGQGLKR